MDNVALEVKHVSKVFPGTKALDDVNLEIRKQEIHSIWERTEQAKVLYVKF